jgi:protein-tyrosine phosphatase
MAGFRYFSYEHEHAAGDLRRLLASPGATTELARALMVSLYKRIPYDLESSLKHLFRLLVVGDLPLVFNCAGGKDRTGVAAALVLSALEVSREIILKDYMLTDECFDRSCALFFADATIVSPFRGVPREVWEPVMRVDSTYLLAMFQELEHAYGSVSNYLATQLSVDAQSLARLRHNLLD